MSGRVRWLRDGELVTGYRKTDRRNPRTPSPTKFRLVFQLPKECWAVSKGAHGAFVEVGELNNVSVESGYAEITLEQAAEFLHAICKGHDYIAISGVMQYGTRRDNVQLIFSGRRRDVVTAFYGAMKPQIFPAKL